MGSALTYGDTFTLPATGDKLWAIRDSRSRAYPWPGFEDLPQNTGRADAVSDGRSAHYDAENGWSAHGPDRDVLEAQLNALECDLPGRTDEEWTALHLNAFAVKVDNAVRAATGGQFATFPVLTHPLVPEEVTAAHLAATAAVATLRRENDPALFERVYTAALTALRA
jgi:hypothetical protein